MSVSEERQEVGATTTEDAAPFSIPDGARPGPGGGGGGGGGSGGQNTGGRGGLFYSSSGEESIGASSHQGGGEVGGGGGGGGGSGGGGSGWVGRGGEDGAGEPSASGSFGVSSSAHGDASGGSGVSSAAAPAMVMTMPVMPQQMARCVSAVNHSGACAVGVVVIRTLFCVGYQMKWVVSCGVISGMCCLQPSVDVRASAVIVFDRFTCWGMFRVVFLVFFMSARRRAYLLCFLLVPNQGRIVNP